jgi:hypothetical protein
MTISEALPASEAPRSVHAQSSHKRTKMAVATLLLTTGFVLAGAPAVTAALAATNNHVPSVLGTLALPCGGETPGFCP